MCCEEDDYTGSQIRTEGIIGGDSGTEEAEDKASEESDEDNTTEEPGFFGDHREDEIGWRNCLWEISEDVLRPLEIAFAVDSAGADGKKTLLGIPIISFACASRRAISVAMQECIDGVLEFIARASRQNTSHHAHGALEWRLDKDIHAILLIGLHLDIEDWRQ